eukprot:gnl/TRDRNA2_/TRDRNA2_173045_c0_seq3.p1 gnl/TRDRNA2_/TRDRNA2_173045_c0~~gnl/TRDRNA2_/TRDRNA2_173045_c0_seq3.p1  ORF type:complete len:355 (-),score=64.82 gnl/TRDRNA2_/TRDRNA2_173045_c0_seq3:17-931(-)
MKGQQESPLTLAVAGVLALGLIAGRGLYPTSPSSSLPVDLPPPLPGVNLPIELPDGKLGAALERRHPDQHTVAAIAQSNDANLFASAKAPEIPAEVPAAPAVEGTSTDVEARAYEQELSLSLADDMTKMVVAALSMLGVVCMLVDSHEMSDAESTEEHEPYSKEHEPCSEDELPSPLPSSSGRGFLCAGLLALLVLGALGVWMVAPAPPAHPAAWPVTGQELVMVAQTSGAMRWLHDETATLLLASFTMLGVAAMLIDAHEAAEEARHEEPRTEDVKAPRGVLTAAVGCTLTLATACEPSLLSR